MTTTTPTVAEFLTQPLEDEDDQEYLPPLESIADSLRQLALHFAPMPESSAESGLGKVPGAQYDALLHDFEELEAANKALVTERDEVLALIKKSTSKLANSIRDVLDPKPAAEPEGSQLEETSARSDLVQPAHDDSVEAWRAYARHLGHGRTGLAYDELELMNRSQVRTLLGVKQPIEAS